MDYLALIVDICVNEAIEEFEREQDESNNLTSNWHHSRSSDTERCGREKGQTLTNPHSN